MIYIGIDPGKHRSHAAVLSETRRGWEAVFFAIDHPLTAPLPSLKALADLGAVACIEKPMCYPGSKTPPNDIVDLAYSAGICEGILAHLGIEVKSVAPAAWKGTVPKPIHNARVLARADAEKIDYSTSLSAIVKGQRNHYVDALGLALYARDGFRIKSRNRGAL